MLIILSDLFGIVILLVLIYLLGRPIVHGAIYFPTSPRAVREVVTLADIRAGQKVVDLGSGDGRLLIACAERGAIAVGYEINPLLVWKSRREIARVKAVGKLDRGANITVHWKSFWRVDLSQFDVVIVYGIPYIMQDLQHKLERELRPGTKVVSNAFKFPGWEPIASERKVRLYIWK